MKSSPHRTSQVDQQPPAAIAQALTDYLAEHPNAVLLESGAVLFDFRTAKFSLSTEHNRCMLHLWDEERNITRRVLSAEPRAGVLRLSVQRFGQTKPQTLELVADRDRRTPSAREATRKQYLRALERVLTRSFPDWKVDTLHTAMDLERSFGPAYARGVLTRGQFAWAIIGVNPEESPATIDGVLTLGILWLQLCRERGDGRRVFAGLRVIVPKGTAALTLARMYWLNPRAAQWELFELDPRTEEITPREPADHGNLLTRILHAPDEAAARERFADSIARVRAVTPDGLWSEVTVRARTNAEIAFSLHGLEFARARSAIAQNSFAHAQQITFGAGANETELTSANEAELRELVHGLFARRRTGGSSRDILYRMQPERWLESLVKARIASVDEQLKPEPVYTQVPAFAAGDRGMLDLLAVTRNSRLAVLELKADEDLHLALQALDYWIRVRWHHRAEPGPGQYLGQLQQHGYFRGPALSPEDPLLYLVVPALRIHPATEVVLRYLKPEIEWQIVALDEHWRSEIKVVFRKRSSDRGV